MGGIEATRVITDQHPYVKVIVLTTFDLDDYAFGSLKAGASAFLLKSSTPESLVAAVKTVAAGDSVVAPRITTRLIEYYLTSPEMRSPENHDNAARSAQLNALSPRERDIFTAVVKGLNNAEISAELRCARSWSPSTCTWTRHSPRCLRGRLPAGHGRRGAAAGRLGI